MSYEYNGNIIESDKNGYLVNTDDWNEEVAGVIAAAENVVLTEKSWDLINYLRDEYFNNGGTQPNDRTILKAMCDLWGEKLEAKALYELFPMQPSKQATKIAGLPETRRKGGY
jgi:tRNA 2-thiouridine synthesizing protein E